MRFAKRFKMGEMGCKFCGAKSKYKCPKCFSDYCSINCFKSLDHLQLDDIKQQEQTQTFQEKFVIDTKESNPKMEESKYERIIKDEVIQQLLRENALQIHLSAILKLFQQLPAIERNDLINIRINELRKGGSEENELVEEFVQRFLYLNDKY